jgi:Cu/Zn superoxide dismutase
MKNLSVLFASLCLLACGGKAKPPKAAPPPPTDDRAGSETEMEPEPEAKPPEPPPPTIWHAKAALAPIKGSKMKAATVSFSQTEGESVQVMSDAPIEGLKPGTYHLVIHANASCGPNATKAGAAWPSTGTGLDISVPKGGAGSIDKADGELALDGDHSVIGHTLVLHDDRRGKPGKALACGAITGGDESTDAE